MSDEQRKRLRQGERERDEWAAYNGLRQSHASTDPVPWLLGLRSPSTHTIPPWYDHGTRWTRDGKPYCLVGQPYSLGEDALSELLCLVNEHGLDVTVSTSPAWHYPGEVLSVVVRSATGVEQDRITFVARRRAANTIKHPSGLTVRKADPEIAGLRP